MLNSVAGRTSNGNAWRPKGQGTKYRPGEPVKIAVGLLGRPAPVVYAVLRGNAPRCAETARYDASDSPPFREERAASLVGCSFRVPHKHHRPSYDALRSMYT